MKLFISLTYALVVAALVSTGCATKQTHPAPAHSAALEIKTNLATLPETVTSFGAVSDAGWLYVFGGHRGERHEYSKEMVSGKFYRLNLNEGRAWEQLPDAAPAQGVPLVARGGSVYRLGGMAARNAADAKQDLYSMALVQRFQPAHGQWETLAPLPGPRSSHDAVVLGERIYVAGGWQMMGGTNKAVWPADALVLDLKNPRAGWQSFPQPFQRRALALAALGSRVYCIGGMDSDNQPTLAVDIFDTTTRQWSKGPALPPGKFKGFSCSAIAQDGRIYANAFQGDLLRLAADGKSWEVVGRLQHPRMAHRLVTAGVTQLIALGGEDGEEKRTDLEVLTPAQTARAVSSAAGATQTTNPHAP